METGGELAKIRDENNDYSAPVYAGGGGVGFLERTIVYFWVDTLWLNNQWSVSLGYLFQTERNCVDTVKKSLCRRFWARDIIQNLTPIKNSTEKSTEIWLHLMFYTCDYKFLIFPYFSSAGNCGSWKETETFVRKLKPEANALASSKMLLTALVNELVLRTDNERFKFLEPLWISCSPGPGCIKPS